MHSATKSNDPIQVEGFCDQFFYETEQKNCSVEHSFNPYMNNGGSCVAVAGDDFVVIAADTRLSKMYRIASRSVPKTCQLTDKCILACSGMYADITALRKMLLAKIKLYEFEHNKPPSINAIAQLLSCILYSKRFFPYYSFCLLSGLDEHGKGVVYGYDAVGSFDQHKFVALGSGGSLITSILDNQISGNNQTSFESMDKMGIINIVKDSITSASERDVHTGDSAEIIVIDSSGINTSILGLRED
ncbi:putative proteasome subunit beta type 1 [Cryptosporidium canis]|uniref:Proteasome subunit beta n=1 Tax=Cryptosporidium canis TaxID=195482 RepID=A0ABQ8P2K8_9CRYT|nr:putative proteasome subunit beta type 1 [Cryptosporidium canis]KAJ1612277.1 putative proteasome subunit beta type 1 [Cryptosporidium canis]